MTRVMSTFFKSIYILLNFIILRSSSSPIPIFFDRCCPIYAIRVYATPFPLITLGLNAQLGTTASTTVARTTVQNNIINGTVPTNINNVSSPFPPGITTTVTTLLPINNVRIATPPIVPGALRSRTVAPGSVVSFVNYIVS